MEDDGWNSDDQYDYYDDDSRYDDSGRYSDFSDVIGDNSRGNGSAWGNKMQERAERRNGAKNLGRAAEKGAAGKKQSSFMTAVQNAREAEKKGEFKNNVEGKSYDKVAAATMAATPGAKKLIAIAKKNGPFATILTIVAILITVFANTQGLAPFGLVANGLDQFNNLRTAMNKRTTYFNRFSLDRRHNVSVTKASIFGPEKFKISNRLSKKLKKQNIYYVDTDDFECRFLVFEDNDTGRTYAVAANDADVERLPSGGIDVDVDGSGTKVHFDIDGNSRMKIDDALLSSTRFSESLDISTRTLKGHIAGWFDEISSAFHDRIGSSRNKMRSVPKDATEEDVKNSAKPGAVDQGMDETIKGTADSDAEELRERQKVDADGNPVFKDGKPVMEEYSAHIDTDGDAIPKNASKAQIEGALTKKTKAVVGALGTGTDVACMVMKAYNMLSILMAGVMIANIMNYVTGFLESIQKTQAGDAGKMELSYYMTGLSQKGITTDADGNTVREGTNSLMSPAWNQFFSSGDLVLHSDDEVAEKFNIDYVMKNGIDESAGVIGKIVSQTSGLTSVIGGGIAAYKTCIAMQGATAAADLVVDIILAFFSLGIGTFIKEWAADLFKAAILTTVVSIIVGAFSALLPRIAQWMAKDFISDMAGEDAAYAINSGFNIYLGRQMQSSSGLPANEDRLMAHWRAQQEVIAEEGALERSMRSPFDPTSKYTFLGSIVNSLMPIANTWSSPLSTISKTVNTVGSSLMSLRPTANAEGEARFETSLRYDCPNLKQLDLVGDVFCNPYFVTDMSTMTVDPATVFDQVATEKDKMGIDDNFKWDTVDNAENNGNPEINPGGELSKWVLSCAARDSQFGQVDSNVMNALASLINTGSGVLDTAINTGVNLLPFVGDAMSIADAAMQDGALDWASGQSCVSPEYKYYSRYSEDQRLMESAGIIEESAVAKFLNEYYEKNPVDNSYEGIIARYSGMTKDQVEETFAYIDVLEWLAEYNPENYGPEEFAPKPDGSYQYESSDIIAGSEEIIVGRYIIYDDVRNKVKIA